MPFIPLPVNLNSKQLTYGVVIFSLLIGAVLTVSTWNINFWPSDTEMYFIEPALRLHSLNHISQIHESFDEVRVRWLHGKEMFILSASIMQGVINDFETLRPFILVCILSFCSSAILIFLLARRYWGEKIGLLAYGIFITSFWPYIYILFAKHQPLGLFFFLLALLLLWQAKRGKAEKILIFLSGASIATALYASSISTLYVPYYIAGFFYHYRKNIDQRAIPFLKTIVVPITLIIFGGLVIIAYFNYPNIAYNIKSYLEYVQISGQYNHFFYNQRVLEQWFPAHELKTRGGWLWILKYFQLIMPIAFPLFLTCNFYQLWRGLKNRKNIPIVLVVILLSWSPSILAEIRQVAQYGANYFASFAGIIFMLCYTAFIFLKEEWPQWSVPLKRTLLNAAVILVLLHAGINVYTFWDDIYPSRMATTFISEKIKKLGADYIYTYARHPQRVNIVDNLNQELLKKVKVKDVDFLFQAKDGYILVPPVTGNSIYFAGTSFYVDFDDDILLNELWKKGNFKDYVAASFKTLASSRIWPHEEEILTYRYLLLNHFSKDIAEKGRAWIVDADKIQRDFSKNAPSYDYAFIATKNIRNIGVKNKVYVYRGYIWKAKMASTVSEIATRMYKVGDPTDQLVAYIYHSDAQQVTWVPVGKNFKSDPVDGRTLGASPDGQTVRFRFKDPLILKPGSDYFFVIYRTGSPSDQNFYRIYRFELGLL